MNTPTRARRLLGAAVSLALLTTACGGESPRSAAENRSDSAGATQTETPANNTEPTPDPVADPTLFTLGVPGQSMQVTFAPYTSVPIDRGFFEEEGLEVDMINMAGSAEAVEAVLAGQLDAALILSPPVFKAIETGADVMVFYNHITRNAFVPHVPVDSPIQQVIDLAGTTVGVVSPGAGSTPQIMGLVEREGGDASGMEFIPVGAGPDVAEQVRNGNIDVVGLWDSVYASIEGQGVELRPVSTDWFDDLGFQGVFIAASGALTENPEIFARFGRAVAKSTLFTVTNPDAAISSHWTVYPDSKPAGMDEDAAWAVGRAALGSRLPVIEQPDGGWGAATAEEVELLQQVLVDGGFLDDVLPVERVWTNALVEQFGDFDEQVVIDLAEGADA